MRNWLKQLWRGDKSRTIVTFDGKARNDAEVRSAWHKEMVRECCDSFAEAVARGDDQAAMFSRQLALQTLAGIERHEYEPAKWANGGLIAITSEVNEGADRFMWHETGQTDEGDKLLANEADDFPLVNTTHKENTGRVASFGRAFAYSTQDLRKARWQGGLYDVVRDKSTAAREALDRNLNRLIAGGSQGGATQKFKGVFAAARSISAGNLGATGGWDAATAADPKTIHADMQLAWLAITETKVEMPDTATMPLSTYHLLQTTRNSDASDRTILEFLKAAYPQISRWDWTSENDDFGSGCLLLYNRSPEKIRVELPMPPRPLPTERRGRNYRTDMEARYAGLIVKRPQSILRVDGIK